MTVVADDGCRLWTRVTGEGPAVVLVHGGPGWWDYLDDLAAMLADDFTVWQWDQRGGGRSEVRGPFTVDRYVADLAAVTGGRKVRVVGHSWGAALALEYAHRFPVERLLLVSSTGLDGPPPSYRERVAEILAGEPYDDEWLARISTGFADRSTAMDLARRLNTPRFVPNKIGADALIADLNSRPDRKGACAAVDVPTLLIHGEFDLRPPSVTDSLLAALPDAERTIVPGAAHYPWLENPEEFRRQALAFLTAG